MQLYDALDEMFYISGKSVTEVEKKLYKSHPITTGKYRKTMMGCDKVARIANVCGYELALVPKGRVDDDCIIIEGIQRASLKSVKVDGQER